MSMNQIGQLILLLPVLILSLSVHEFSHGFVSHKLGDPTPANHNRLTLNPLAHLSLMGSLVLILTRRFGWAKPVPIDPRYYKNPRKGMMLVSFAGPGSNFTLALVFSLVFHILAFMKNMNVEMIMGVLNNPQFNRNISGIMLIIFTVLFNAIIINISLGIFNLLPVPPLDGSKILRGVLPPRYDQYLAPLEGPMGMMILLLLASTGILIKILQPIIGFITGLILFL